MGSNLVRFLKNILKTLFYYLGIFKIFAFISKSQKRMPILLYHRVIQDSSRKTHTCAFALRGLAISKEGFRRQIEYLVRNYKVISLGEYIKKRQLRQSLRGCAVITFDDGFRDFRETALGVLRKNNCPATVFIIGNSQRQVYWRHKLYAILDHSEKKQCKFMLDSRTPVSISLINENDKYATLLLLIDILEKLSDEKRENIITRLREELAVSKGVNIDDLYLSPGDLKNLLKANLEIGAHSLSHRDLTTLDKQSFKREIDDSLEYVKEITGKNDVSFSVPFGVINEEIVEYLKLNNVKANVTGKEGLNRHDEDIFLLKRLFIAEDNLAQFVYKISGTQMFLRDVWKNS